MRSARWLTPVTRTRTLLACALALCLCSSASRVEAGPQWHLALSPGGCYVDGPTDAGWFWCGSASGHALFLRDRDHDFGLGPYARVLTVLGDSTSASAGVSALVPVNPTFPFIVSVGALANTRGAELAPGADLWLFWGPTSYNFHSSYSMVSGVLLGAQRTWGAAPGTTIAFAGQLDLALAAIPFIALFELVRGPPER
ncbi:MAG TPA: hypothetical protein VI197_20405 [Polyangiaceae bacterium]